MQRALKAPRLLSIALMVALVYGVTLFAPAAVYAGPKPTLPTQLKITKKLVGPTGSIPAETLFSFAFEKVSFNDFTDGANLDKMPDIPAQELTLGTTTQGNTSQDGGTATTTLTRQLNIALEPTNGDALPGPPTVSPRPGGPNGLINLSMKLPFSHPGIYKYRLTEPDNGANPNILMSRASYVLTLLVESQGPFYKTTSFTAEREKDDDGAAAAGKINAAADDVVFLNRVIPPNSKLTIAKTVKGEFADRGKDFNFALTIVSVPSTAAPAASYTGKIDGQAYQFTPGTPTTFKLYHNQELVFDEIPVGARFTYTETGVAGWIASASTIFDTPGIVPTAQAGSEGADFTLDPYVVAGTSTSSTLTNTYKSVTPTGIAMKILSYVVMIAIPVLAVVAHLAHRRRMGQSA